MRPKHKEKTPLYLTPLIPGRVLYLFDTLLTCTFTHLHSLTCTNSHSHTHSHTLAHWSCSLFRTHPLLIQLLTCTHNHLQLCVDVSRSVQWRMWWRHFTRICCKFHNV